MEAECRLLYDNRPLVVNPELASLIGLSEALILHQIHYWVKLNQKARKNKKEGHYWTYNTFKEWADQFPFWSVSTIKRIIKKLTDDDIIIVGRFNRSNIDRTKWYRINHEKLNFRMCHIDTKEGAKLNRPLVQSEPISEATDSVNLTPPIPETNKQRLSTEISVSETSSSLKKPHAPKLHSRWIFAEMQKALGYPEKTDKDPIPNYGKEAKAIDRMTKRGYTEADILAAWKEKVEARGEFVSMTWVNEDIGKPGKPRQSAFRLPDEDTLAAAAKGRGLL